MEGNGQPIFERGDKVRIIEGPYRGAEALIDEIVPQHSRMTVITPVRGQLTRLEVTYAQVRPL